MTANNDVVDLCIRVKDDRSHKVALEILWESEEHVDWLETQLCSIATVGLERYLSEQMSSDEDGE